MSSRARVSSPVLSPVERAKDEDGFWVVECPSLTGCLSQGATKAEALNNIHEAIDLYIESLRADGLPVPEDLFHAELVPV